MIGDLKLKARLRELANRIEASTPDTILSPAYISVSTRDVEALRTAAGSIPDPAAPGEPDEYAFGRSPLDHPERQEAEQARNELGRLLAGAAYAHHEDPWRHRSENMRCKTCMFYVPKDPPTLGRCRRRAPTLDGWPAVTPRDWCGEHKVDEGKI